ncbi:acyltransferase [Olivibacter ginsenosidimutans]
MYATTQNPSLLKTKQHYAFLDGLRGIAAIAVVIFHFMEIATPDYKDNFIAHSYLAVDFFFCLSGFVIAYAYDNKIRQIGTASFLKLRLIRLHPLVIICSVIGLLAFIFDPFSNLHAKFTTTQVLLLFLSSCFLIPYPLVPERYFNLFHLNPPTWSLFWEYIANVFYVLVLFKQSNKILRCLVLLAAFLLGYESYRSGYLGVGWGGDNFIGGGIRIFYSFLAGMLVYRTNWIIRTKLRFIPLAALLALVFFIPFSESLNWVIDPLLVIFYFPFLIALGAGTGVNSTPSAICKFLGNISYPLYMVHYPFIWIFMSYVERYKPALGHMAIIIPVAVMLLIGLAYLIMVTLDIPFRQYLKDKMKKHLSPKEASQSA